MIDAFISYRRLDGRLAAQRLRRRLLDYRFPRPLRKTLGTRRLAIYLDTLYERATSDFFEGTIVPALRDAKHLIVVQTPAALRAGPGGGKNWVVREIEIFRSLPQGDAISVALARGSMDDPLPADLHETLPNVERVDIRRLGPFGFGARDEVLKFAAALHSVPLELMPELRREEAKRRARMAWSVAGAAMVIIAVLGVFLWLALVSRAAARTAQQTARHELATAHLRAAAAGREHPADAVAHAAKAVRADPEYRSARMLLLDLLMNRQWPLPLAEAVQRDAVVAVAFSPDDTRFATATKFGTVRIWRTRDGAPLTPPFHVRGEFIHMSFAPDWSTVAVGAWGGWGVWDVASGKPLASGTSGANVWHVPPDSLLIGTADASLLCDATGRRCVKAPDVFGLCGTRAATKDGWLMQLIDLRTGRFVGKLHAEVFGRIVFSDDCTSIVTTVARDGIHLWHGDGSPAGQIAHESRIDVLEFSADGTKLLGSDDDGHLLLWRLPALEVVLDIPIAVHDAHFAAHGTLIVSASGNEARLFDASTGAELSVPATHADTVNAVAVSRDGTKLLTGSADGIARVWDVRPGITRAAEISRAYANGMRISADSRRVAVCDGKKTEVFDLSTGRALAPPFTYAGNWFVQNEDAFDRDLRRCLLIERKPVVRELPSGRNLGGPAPSSELAPSHAALDDTSTYAAVIDFATVEIWPVNSPARGRRLLQIGPRNVFPFALAFVPGKSLVAIGWEARGDRDVHYLSLASPDLRSVRTVPTGGEGIGLHVAADGNAVLLRGDRSARLWSLQTLSPLGPVLRLPGNDKIEHVSSNADGGIAATATANTVYLWNARTGTLLTDPLRHGRGLITTLTFTEAGDRLMTAGDDGVRMWDVPTGVMLTFNAIETRQAALAADESRIVASDVKGTWIFDLASGTAKDAELLAEVSETIAGLRVNAAGAVEPLLRRVDVLHRAKDGADSTAVAESSAALVRWLLADRAARGPSPFRGVADVHSAATKP